MKILDTDVLTVIQRREGTDYKTIAAKMALEQPETLFITIVSIEEQMRGWLSVVARKRRPVDQVDPYRRLHRLIIDYRIRKILDFDDAAATTFAGLRKKRIRIGTMDLKIAAIALANSATLISRNLSDFQIVPNLTVEDWTN